jgi:hypothetical protein
LGNNREIKALKDLDSQILENQLNEFCGCVVISKHIKAIMEILYLG